MTDIMKFIRKERIRQELSQEKLAYAVQVNHATISLWETYKYCPRFDDVENMLNFLGYEIVIRKKVKKNGKSNRKPVCK